MIMEIKNYRSADKTARRKSTEPLKIKINGFLLDYFNYLILILSLIILVAGLFILVYPKYRQIAKANEAAKNNLQIEYETKLNYLNSIRNLRKTYQSISDDDKAKIDALAPPAGDTSVIITEIESIALRNGAILNSVKIEPPSAVQPSLTTGPGENKESPAGIFNQLPAGAGLIKIEVNLSSVDYPLLKNIIKAFENNLRLFDIAKISFNVDKSQALLNIYSYYLPR